MQLILEVVSDLICPWCYVGKRRLEKALLLLKAERPDVEVQLTWLPFELNPDMPPEGCDRYAYRTAKFGSWERSQQLDAQMAQIGREEGLVFDYTHAKRTPNTLAGHRLLWLAAGEDGAQCLIAPQGQQVQNALVETLFKAYFSEGRDVGDLGVLAAIAASCGLDEQAVAIFLAGDLGTLEIRAKESFWQRNGVQGVPFTLIQGIHGVSGAQPAEVFLDVIREILREIGDTIEPGSPPEAPAVATGCEGGACAVVGA